MLLFELILIVISICFSIYGKVVATNFDKLVREMDRKNNEKRGEIHGHGARTLLNGFHNIVNECIFLILALLMDFFIREGYFSASNLFINSILIVLLGFCIPSALYKITEYKHVIDNNLTGTEKKERDKFFTWYSSIGAFSLIIDIVVMVCSIYSFEQLVIILLIITLGFLMGMADLLQVRGVDDYYDEQYSKNQNKYTIDIIINIYRFLFNKEFRLKNKRHFLYNMSMINMMLKRLGQYFYNN